MSIETIYIEAGDEITTVIERLKKAEQDTVALVAPKGAILLQSIVNLKLAKRAAEEVSKQIVLVSTDKIGRNLATQLGIPVTANEKDAMNALSGTLPPESMDSEESTNIISGVRIHRYYDNPDDETAETGNSKDSSAADPIIIPKNIMQESEKGKTTSPVPVVVPTSLPRPETTPEPAPMTIPEPLPVPLIEGVTLPAAIETDPLNRSTIDMKADEPLIPSGMPDKKPDKKPRKNRVLYFVLFIVLLLVVAAGATSFLFLPSTTVTIAVPTESWTKDLDFNANSSITSLSDDNLTLPAEVVSADATDKLTFKATGTKDEGTTATGTVDLYNFDSTTPQTLPAGTTITASSLQFTTQSAVTVPGFTQPNPTTRNPGHASTGVTAVKPGTDSNLTDATITAIPVNGGVTLSGKINSSGGTSKTVTVVSASDVNNAKDGLTLKLKDAARAKLGDALKNRDPRFDDKTDQFTLGNLTVSAQVGAEADSADVTATGTMKRLIVDFAQIKNGAEARLAANQPVDKKSVIDSIDLTTLKISSDGRGATLTVHAAGKNTPIISVDSLRTNLVSHTEQAGKALILSAIPNATISISYKPTWWPVKHFPSSARFLHLSVKYE
jgi:hypothetical protein